MSLLDRGFIQCEMKMRIASVWGKGWSGQEVKAEQEEGQSPWYDGPSGARETVIITATNIREEKRWRTLKAIHN